MAADVEFHGATARQLSPTWNSPLLAASIAISFLGSFTSAQLMCQAKTARYLSGVVVWLSLSSLIFGFCSIFLLHFIAMLACELDLPIGLDPPLTILSALLAVIFTFIALGSDLLMERYNRLKRRRAATLRRESRRRPSAMSIPELSRKPSSMSDPEAWVNGGSSPPSPAGQQVLNDERPRASRMSSNQSSRSIRSRLSNNRISTTDFIGPSRPDFKHDPLISKVIDPLSMPLLQDERPLLAPLMDENSSVEGTDTDDHASDFSASRRSSGITDSDSSMFGLGKFASVMTIKPSKFGTKNPFVVTALALWAGLTIGNIIKGLLWSLAITGMHYTGILALRVPHGRCKLDPALVVVSALISWVVCVVGAILMASMEIHIGQQLLFSIIATTGVAAMHFTGMRAATFWSSQPPSVVRGYPPVLAIAIGSIAIFTCFAANGLLAHSAATARNKLAEVVHTRKKLWSAIAQKEHAEAAAVARSEFIASASHEIRTPLHQLQGYSDLLSRTELSEESRLLLYAIQDATRSLSLITNNVLDWSRLEKGEAVCRPTALDIRKVLDSITNLLPTKDEEAQVELLIAVAPDIPKTLFLDESYIARCIMNLVSNSLKFTASGYVLLRLYIEDAKLKIVVSDTGPGIPDSFLPELFEPFKQAQTRGAHRGTGLGLSIVLQLLQKMQGTIETESRHQDTIGVGPERSGTVFTTSLPVHPASDSGPRRDHLRKKLALMGDYYCPRTVEGITKAWQLYDVEVQMFEKYSPDISTDWMIWADASLLSNDPELVKALAQQEHCPVIIPYEEERQLRRLLRVAKSNLFVTIHKPAIFHDIVDRLITAGHKPTRPDPPNRIVRFSSLVDVLEDTNGETTKGDGSATIPKTNGEDTASIPKTEPPPKPRAPTLLLVEDNKINQRLGAKMCKTLGYDVITANDGQEAVDLIIANDAIIDAVLMDQNMPVKDGLTATIEIRQMESNGKLQGRERRPIIAVTAVVGPHAEARCREAGTDAFLPKPLSLAKLRDTLDMFGITGGDG